MTQKETCPKCGGECVDIETLCLEELQEILEKLRPGPQIVGDYIIQPISWGEDDNGNVIYDIESIEQEFEYNLRELEEHNDNIEEE